MAKIAVKLLKEFIIFCAAMQVSDQVIQMSKKIIKDAEGYSSQIYQDTAQSQNQTVYWGHKRKAGQKFNGTKQEAEKIFLLDFQEALKTVVKMFGKEKFQKLQPSTKAVLIDMAFNMGNFKQKFPKMCKAIQNGDMKEASYHLLYSKYRVQTKARAYRNAYILLQGKMLTKEQGLDKALHDGLLEKGKNGKIKYDNNIDDPRLKLVLKPRGTDAEMAELIKTAKESNIGGVSFSIDPISTRLSGFICEDSAVKILEGDIFDQSNFSLMDLVVPLKIMYDSSIKSKNISVSLDPLVPTQPDGPWYRKTFYPSELASTDYGHDMIMADYLMKQLSLGVDEERKPFPYPQRLLEMGLDMQSIFKAVQQKTYEGSRTRLWIVIKDYEIGLNDKFIQVKDIKMGVELKALEVSQNGSLRDCNSDPSPLAKRFSQIFTTNYDELAQYYPVLAKMKRLAKASIIAKFMYFRRVPVDIELINRLFDKERQEFEERIPRLENKLRKQMPDRIIEMSVLGGCTFDISNMQNKISQLEKQVREMKSVFQTKDLNTNRVALKMIPGSKQDIGQYFYIRDEKDQIKNYQLYPFLFQALVRCKHCGKTCNLDYYSVTNRECVEHSTMKCKICSRLVLPGDPFKTNSDKGLTFHEKCFNCGGCSKKIDGSFANVDGGFYHPDCVPKKPIGQCGECGGQILQNEQYAKNPQTGTMYHGKCALELNKRIQDSIPCCKSCGVKLAGQYVKLKEEPYHQLCAKKILGHN